MHIKYEEYKISLKGFRNHKNKYIREKAEFHLNVLYEFKIKSLQDIYRNQERISGYLIFESIGKEIIKMNEFNK